MSIVPANRTRLIATHRTAVHERVNVHRPLTAQTQKDLQHTDASDANQTRVIILVDAVNEDPTVNPQRLHYHERHGVAVEHPFSRIVQADGLHEFVYP